MALGFGRRPKERPAESAEEFPVPMPGTEDAVEGVDAPPPELFAVSEPATGDESPAAEAAPHEWGAPYPAEHLPTADEAPPFPPAVRTDAGMLPLLNDLLRLHEAEDVATVSDAADQLTRTHLNGTHLVTLLADKGGSFRLKAPRSGATGALVNRLSEILDTDVRTELPAAHRGRMAKMWMDESDSPQSVSLADFWGSTAGNGPCWRAEKALAISQLTAIRLASAEGPMGIALFICLGEPPDPGALVAVGHHLTVALANLRSVEKARQFGTVDPVRWIPDRQAFARHLSQEMGRARRYGQAFSLVLLIVNNYDALRFEYGWTVANRLLRSISSALRERLRESDYLGSYRHNGFGMILVQTPEEGVPEAVSRLCEAAQGVRVLEGDDGPIPNCEVAIASSPEDGSDARTVLLAAESRLLPKRRVTSAGA